MDSGKLALLEATGITVAERKRAEELYAASILASRVQGPTLWRWCQVDHLGTVHLT